jgi:uncharacterized membrane protein YadS
MTTVIIGAYWIGRKLGFNEKMALMMAGGKKGSVNIITVPSKLTRVII